MYRLTACVCCLLDVTPKLVLKNLNELTAYKQAGIGADKDVYCQLLDAKIPETYQFKPRGGGRFKIHISGPMADTAGDVRAYDMDPELLVFHKLGIHFIRKFQRRTSQTTNN
jgi:hypothetical protein